MSGYFPATAYEPVPEYDNNGYPVRSQQQRFSQSSQGGGNWVPPYSPQSPEWSSHMSYMSPNSYDDPQRGLLDAQQPQQYAQAPQNQQSKPGPPLGPIHRETADFQLPANHQLRHQYRKIKQFRRALASILGRWIMSAIFSGAIVGIFIFYEKDGVLDTLQRHMFNAYYMGASVLLALNLVASFKSMADMFRWKVLASTTYGGHSAKELDLILGLSSYGTATNLLRYWIKKPTYFFLLATWIILGIGAQVGLALIGLTFNQDNGQRTSPGIVNATNFSAFFLSRSLDIPVHFEQNYLAHLYGDISLILGERIEGAPLSPDLDPDFIDIIYMNETNEFKYYFKEYAYHPSGQTKFARTKRYVTVTPKCEWSPIVENQLGGDGAAVIDLHGDGDSVGRNLKAHNWTKGHSGRGTTLYGNLNLNANETEVGVINDFYHINITEIQPTCGPRCGITVVYRFLRGHEVEQKPLPFGDYFKCMTNISAVHGAILPHHEIDDVVATRIASGIGSDAIWELTEAYTFQASPYNSASRWDNWQGLSGREATHAAEFNVGRFAIGSLAVLDQANPQFEIPGNRPWEGVVLKINWTYVYITFGLLLGGQLLIGIIVLVMSNDVFCKDASFLSTARLLRPLVDRMGDHGCAASGDEIANLFRNKHMRYGVRRDQGRNRLDILMDLPERVPGKEDEGEKFTGGVGFPKGYYE